jgi:hypothetical protein
MALFLSGEDPKGSSTGCGGSGGTPGTPWVSSPGHNPQRPLRPHQVHGTGFTQCFGGKGSNQAVIAARLGAAVQFVGKVRWGDNSVNNCGSYGGAKVAGTSAGAFPVALSLSREDSRGPPRCAKGSGGTRDPLS